VTEPSAERRARFEAVYREHYGAVWAYARRRVVGAADADDVAAQTWLTVWRRLDDLPAGRELPWCYGVARRCVANHRRGDDRRMRLVRVVASERERDAIRDTDPRADHLHRALDRLREDDRELLRIAAWERLDHADIARSLGITPNAVALRLHRARRRLAAALKEADVTGHTPGTASPTTTPKRPGTTPKRMAT
jgi:RNA polymerase sigma-70 factor (ECF subfamily)